MTPEQVSNRILTVPNVISFLRLAMIPVFWWLVLGISEIAAATILYAVVATTDWVDGYLARKLDQVTKLGKALDPVADRLMIVSGIVVGLIADIVPAAIGLALIAREVYMALVIFGLMARRGRILAVSKLGKLATFVVYSSIGWFYMAEIPFLEFLTRPLAWIAGVGGLVLYWVTAIQYTLDARRAVSELESAGTTEES